MCNGYNQIKQKWRANERRGKDSSLKIRKTALSTLATSSRGGRRDKQLQEVEEEDGAEEGGGWAKKFPFHKTLINRC